MAAEVLIRPAVEADLGAVVELVRRGLGEGRVPRTRAYWTWKHYANPFGPSYLLVAEADGAVVGLRAFLRWTWRSGNLSVPAVRAVDTVTDPAWRGRGLFRRLTLAMVETARADGAAFVFNTPNAVSRRGYLRMGWMRVGRLSFWLKPLWPRRGPAGEALPAAADFLAASGVDDLLDRLDDGAEARLHTPPRRRYLEWRYAPPGIDYHAAWSLRPGAEAALIFRLVDHGRRRELRICEALVPSTPASVQSARRLLAEAARAARASAATLFAPRATAARRIARSAGFLPLARMGPTLTLRPLDLGLVPVDPRRGRHWSPAIGALELF